MPQYQATKIAAAAFMSAYGNEVAFKDKVTVGTALLNGDTIDLVRVAGGSELVGLTLLKWTDFDTGTTLQFKLGYRKVNGDGALVDDDDYFGTALTTLQAASSTTGVLSFSFDPVTFDEDVIIYATLTAAPTGGGTGSITTVARAIARGVK